MTWSFQACVTWHMKINIPRTGNVYLNIQDLLNVRISVFFFSFYLHIYFLSKEISLAFTTTETYFVFAFEALVREHVCSIYYAGDWKTFPAYR